MSTRSIIAVKVENGYESIYCHWDGYPTHHLPLLENYNSTELAMQLLSLGDLSILGAEIGEKQDFDDRAGRNENWCLAYGRDRGEKDVGKKHKRTLRILKNYAKDVGPYLYIWEHDRWNVVEV